MLKRQAAIRVFVLSLMGAVSGCSWIESFEAMLQDEPTQMAQLMPVSAVAPAPAFRVGDVFRYRVGHALIEESVERIDQQGVWWRDSQGRQWIGNEPTLMPTRAIIKNGEKAEIANVVIEATGDLFPLVPGKTVAYRYTSQGGFYAAQTHEQSCTVAGYEPAQTAAGTFDTYRLECIYNGVRRNNFYAPALGRVMLQTADTIVDSVKRELVGFDRGPSEPARVAQKPPMHHGAGKSMANSMPTSTIAPASGERFGVQLAAYRSQNRARQAWARIRDIGGPLLSGVEPVFEKHNVNGKPIYRVIVGNFPSKAKARAQCRALKQNGIDCWPRARLAGVMSPGVATAPQPLGQWVVQR